MEQLLTIWESSVRSTHLFLSDAELEKIKEYVPQALAEVPHLVIAENEEHLPVGFMGAGQHQLKMLFLSPDEQGQGLGRLLLQEGIEKYGINELTVNEQNPKAKDFYEHMGFLVYKRTDRDEQGAPYPLLYMNIAKKLKD